jgi:tetratricopeptide (TPR) repeat protein
LKTHFLLGLGLCLAWSCGKEAPKTSADTTQPNPSSAEEWYQQGLAYYENQDLTRAIEAFDKCIGLDSLYVSAWHDRGICHFSLDRFEAAKSDFFNAIALDTGYAEAWFNLGLVYDRQQQPDSTLWAFEQSTQANPQFAEGWFNLAVLHMDMGNSSMACTCFKKSADLGDEDAIQAWEKFCP